MLAGICACVACAGAASAEAGAGAPAEVRIGASGSDSISAAGGWVTWVRNYVDGDQEKQQRVLWRSGVFVPSPQVVNESLGTDAAGHAVALDWNCGDCRVVERRLAAGPERVLPRGVVSPADEYRGTLAWVRPGHGIYVRRPRARRPVLVSHSAAGAVALGPRRLVYENRNAPGEQAVIAAVDLTGARPRTRILAIDDYFDDSCRCTDSFTFESSATIDGRFAYWREGRTTDRFGPAPSTTTRILRVDLSAPHPVVESFTPARYVQSLAVDGGTLYYSTLPFSAGESGTFRVAALDWQPTTLPLPVRG
jgi:hypothetical protein